MTYENKSIKSGNNLTISRLLDFLVMRPIWRVWYWWFWVDSTNKVLIVMTIISAVVLTATAWCWMQTHTINIVNT